MKLIKVGNHYVPINLLINLVPKKLMQAIILVLFVFVLGISTGAGWC